MALPRVPTRSGSRRVPLRITRVPPVNRSQANALVDAALKSGRIIQADHDMRLEQIKSAASDQEVDMIVRDLQTPAQMAAASAVPMVSTSPPSVGAPTGSTQASGQPWPLVNYGPGQGPAPRRADLGQVGKTGGKWIGGIIGLVVLISVIVPIVGVIIGVVSARDTFDDFDFAEPVDETTYLPGQQPGENGVNVHTIEGYDDMVAGLVDETGSYLAFSAVIYPRYAVLGVPEAATGKRYVNYYWDGRSMASQDFKSTTDDPRLDLSELDAGLMINLLEDVRGRIEDPTSWYISIGSGPTDGAPQIAVYASNEYGEGSYVLADKDGNITYESTYPE